MRRKNRTKQKARWPQRICVRFRTPPLAESGAPGTAAVDAGRAAVSTSRPWTGRPARGAIVGAPKRRPDSPAAPLEAGRRARQATYGSCPFSATIGRAAAAHAIMPPATLTARRPNRLSHAVACAERPPTRQIT